MRVLVGVLILFPIFANARDLGTYQITGGDLSGGGAPLQGTIAGNGFTGSIFGYPLALYSGGATYGGSTDFSMEVSPPIGRDQGLYIATSGPVALTKRGLSPFYSFGGIRETGELTTGLVDITGPGIYTTSFTFSADLAYGKAGARGPAGYADFIGSGTVTVDVTPGVCSSGGGCGPMHFSYADYNFAQAPELDPNSLVSALMLLGGGLLVFRGRRSRAYIAP
jgi:hypothetical protein